MNVYRFFESQGANVVNPATDYIGKNGIFLYKGYNGDDKKKKQYDLVDRYVVLAPHEGIIDSKTWLKCRIKLMNNRQIQIWEELPIDDKQRVADVLIKVITISEDSIEIQWNI